MPICRSASVATPIPEHRRVRLSRYIVNRRIAVRAANDNRRTRMGAAWPWALAVAALPTLTAVVLLAELF